MSQREDLTGARTVLLSTPVAAASSKVFSFDFFIPKQNLLIAIFAQHLILALNLVFFTGKGEETLETDHIVVIQEIH